MSVHSRLLVLFAYVVIAGLVLSGCAQSTLLSQSGVQTAIAATDYAAVLLLPTSTPTPRQLPPTWTPAPTSTATETRTPKPTPTVSITPTPVPFTPKPADLTLTGKGSDLTAPFYMVTGEVKITWTYDGSPVDQQTSKYMKNIHESNLTILEVAYENQEAFMEDQIKAARDRGDTTNVDYWEEQLSEAYEEYKDEVAKENSRYSKELNEILSRFSLEITRVSQNSPQMLVEKVVMGKGTVTIDVERGSDYYFIVTAEGTWTIDVKQ